MEIIFGLGLGIIGYITNNKETPVSFVFDYDGENLKVSVKEAKLI